MGKDGPMNMNILRYSVKNIGARQMLTCFAPNKLTLLVTDAAEVLIGAVLERERSPLFAPHVGWV